MENIETNKMKNRITVILIVIAVLFASYLIIKDSNKNRNSINLNEPETIKEVAGTYIAFMKAASSPGRTIILTLDDNDTKTATFLNDYQNNKPFIIENGIWAIEKESNGVVIVLDDKNINFDFEDNQMKIVDPKKEWGEDGLTLKKFDLELNTEWVWDKDDKFIMKLNSDGSFTSKGDCNSMFSSFEIKDNSFSFYPIASTKKFCPDTKENLYMENLKRVYGYEVKNGELHFNLKGIVPETMVFKAI